MNSRRILSTATVALGAVLLSIGVQTFAYSAPTGSPTNSDAAAPLNTGSAPQSKTGPLTAQNLYATQTFSTLDGRFVVQQAGNVGIGTNVPAAKLDVVGNAKFAGGITVANTVDAGNLCVDGGCINDMYLIPKAGSGITIENGIAGMFGIGAPYPTSIGLDTTNVVQKRVTGTCPFGKFVTGVGADGSVTCSNKPTVTFYSNTIEQTPVTIGVHDYCSLSTSQFDCSDKPFCSGYTIVTQDPSSKVWSISNDSTSSSKVGVVCLDWQ